MTVERDQIRVVRDLMDQRRVRATPSHATSTSASATDHDGGPVNLHTALTDLVVTTGAVDGALVMTSDEQYTLGSSVRGRFLGGPLDPRDVPALFDLLTAGTPQWLPRVTSTMLLHGSRARVLGLRFATGDRWGIALLAYAEEVPFSAYDQRWMAHTLSTATAGDPPALDTAA